MVAVSKYCAEAPDILQVTVRSTMAALKDIFPGVDLAPLKGLVKDHVMRAVNIILEGSSKA